MSNVYESDALVSQYCELHYGSEYFEVPLFPVAVVDKVIEMTDGATRGAALDVGCAVGRSVFELAHDYERVEGVDFSESFVKTAEQMCFEGELRWDNVEEGEILTPAVARLEELSLEQARSRVSFEVGDACALPEVKSGYDLITAFNLLCRLPDPKAFLQSAASRLNPGGYMALTTPATWLEEFTPKENWIGGVWRDDRTVTTMDGLREVLWGPFQLVEEPIEIPFVIRETSRKYQHSFAQFSLWKLSDDV